MIKLSDLIRERIDYDQVANYLVKYYKLKSKVKKMTGCSMVVNTSFNVRGEPIVCTPQDAYRCFMRTEMDVLVLQNQILFKEEQPKTEKDETWMQEFELD